MGKTILGGTVGNIEATEEGDSTLRRLWQYCTEAAKGSVPVTEEGFVGTWQKGEMYSLATANSFLRVQSGLGVDIEIPSPLPPADELNSIVAEYKIGYAMREAAVYRVWRMLRDNAHRTSTRTIRLRCAA